MLCIRAGELDYFGDSRHGPVCVIDGSTLEVIGWTDSAVIRRICVYRGVRYRAEPVNGSAWAKLVPVA